jgi:tellurite resistance protein TerC
MILLSRLWLLDHPVGWWFYPRPVAVSLWVWIGSLLAAGTLLGVGAVLLQSRWARRSGLAVGWLVATVVLVTIAAVALGWGGGVGQGVTLFSEYAQEAPFAIDTVLAFALILQRYLPDGDHQTAALYGVATTLVLRVVFIGTVTGLLATFTWLLYLVGLLLVYAGYAFVRDGHPRPAEHGGTPERWLTRRLVSWGRRTRKSGLAYLPPLVLAVMLLTLEDPLAWPDGGPAYQTVLANILALLPIPILVGYSEKLLALISYLPYGLASVGGFLGVKIILFALRDNVLPFLNAGEPVEWAPETPAWISFLVTAGTIGVAVGASLRLHRRGRRHARRGMTEPATDATESLAPPVPAHPDPIPQSAAALHSSNPRRDPDPAGRRAAGAAAPRVSGRARSTVVVVIVAVMTGLVVVAGVLAHQRWLRRRGQPSSIADQ